MAAQEIPLDEIRQRQERAFEPWTAGTAAVVALLTLLASVIGGGALFFARIAVDEERAAATKTQVETISKQVEQVQKDATETRTDVKWIREALQKK